MCGLLLLIFLGLFITGCVISAKRYHRDDGFNGYTIVGGIGGVCALIAVIALTVGVTTNSVKANEIDMREAENLEIETYMADCIENYMEFEKNVVIECAPESSLTLIAAYPELSSDELVKEQIKTYKNNQETIIQLKTDLIYDKVIRWWLYFGGAE